MSLASLIGENIWLLLVFALIGLLVLIEFGMIGGLKTSIDHALQGLSNYLNNIVQF